MNEQLQTISNLTPMMAMLSVHLRILADHFDKLVKDASATRGGDRYHNYEAIVTEIQEDSKFVLDKLTYLLEEM
jgi:hypothetical protein